MRQTSDPPGARPAILRVQRVVVAAERGPISFQLASGAAAVVVDRHGAGAGDLLRLIARVAPPSAGRIEILGRNPAQLTAVGRAALRRRLGLLLGDLPLVEELDGFDNVALAARAAGRRAKDYTAPAVELLAWVGLGRRVDEPAANLDREARVRLALARALINRPEVLIAEAPGEGLAPDGRRAILKLVSDLNAAGTAILMTSRDDDLAERSGAQVVRIGPEPLDEPPTLWGDDAASEDRAGMT